MELEGIRQVAPDPLVARALDGYARTQGQHGPAPTPSGSYALDWNGHHYVIVGNGRGILATYRLVRGSLRLLGNTPRALRQRHRERVRRDGHAAA